MGLGDDSLKHTFARHHSNMHLKPGDEACTCMVTLVRQNKSGSFDDMSNISTFSLCVERKGHRTRTDRVDFQWHSSRYYNYVARFSNLICLIEQRSHCLMKLHPCSLIYFACGEDVKEYQNRNDVMPWQLNRRFFNERLGGLLLISMVVEWTKEVWI